MSASRQLSASSRNSQQPVQPPTSDTNRPILYTGILTIVPPQEPRRSKPNISSTSQNHPALSTGATADGQNRGRGGNRARNINHNAQKTLGTAAPKPTVPKTASSSRPPANFQRLPVTQTAQPQRGPQKPRGAPPPRPLPAAQSLPKPAPRPKPVSIPKPIPLHKSQPLPRNSLPIARPLPLPRTFPAAQTPPVNDQAPAATAFNSEDSGKVKPKQKKFLTPEEKAFKALLRKQRREERKDDRYRLILSAAETTISILKQHDLSCAVFGSLACNLYGDFRDPKDVDLLVFQPLSSDPDIRHFLAEKTKALIVDADPVHYYLKLPRDPEAPYRILCYRRGPKGPFCKVDILVPGTLHLPSIPPPSPSPGLSGSINVSAPSKASSRNYITNISGIPLVPFSILLVHKLQGWSDHRTSLEPHKKRKEVQDAADVRRLLGMGGLMADLIRMKPWANSELFCDEFQQLTKERVREYCKTFPNRAIWWQRLGFETT